MSRLAAEARTTPKCLRWPALPSRRPRRCPITAAWPLLGSCGRSGFMQDLSSPPDLGMNKSISPTKRRQRRHVYYVAVAGSQQVRGRHGYWPCGSKQHIHSAGARARRATGGIQVTSAAHKACCNSQSSFGSAPALENRTTSLTLALTQQSFRAIRFCHLSPD